MGRKSSAKAQAQTAASAQPPKEPPRSFGTPIVVAGVVLVVVVGLLAYSRNGGSSQAETQPPASVAQAPAPTEPPPAAKFGPHKQATLPPLPFGIEQAVRPPGIVRAAYEFAAEHPEVLAYVPCYCGCERSGHRGNDDCFVTRRAANGDVTEWEPHGMT